MLGDDEVVSASESFIGSGITTLQAVIRSFITPQRNPGHDLRVSVELFYAATGVCMRMGRRESTAFKQRR